MSRLLISCYRAIATDSFNKAIQCATQPALAEMCLRVGPENTVSDEFPAYTSFIVLKATVDCHIAFGKEPEADPDYGFVECGERLSFGVNPGDRIAVIGV